MGNCACIYNNNSKQKCINLNDLNNNSPKIICENSPKNNFKSRNFNINNISTNGKSTDNISYDNTFEIKMLNEINFVRTNPRQYALKLNELIQNIKREGDLEYLIPNNNNVQNEKILLKSGRQIFYEAIDFLNDLEPLNELKYSEEIKIQFKDYNNVSVYDKQFILDGYMIGKLILNKRLELLKKYNNCFFSIDIFEDPIISVVFQITDEAFNKERRNAILNKDFTLFSVNFIRDDNYKFLSILTFV